MKKIIIILSFFYINNLFALAISKAPPFTLYIPYDDEAAEFKEKFDQYIKKTKPFSQMGDQFKIVYEKIPASKMGCAQIPNDRRIDCTGRDYFAERAAKVGAHRTLALTSSKGGGMADGDFSIASKHYPIETGIHEFMHTVGFADEYTEITERARQQWKEWCDWMFKHRPDDMKSPNVVYFKPKKEIFASDQEARTLHKKDIPWYHSIFASTLITTSNKLGTDASKNEDNSVVGLYPGGKCSDSMPGWKPHNQSIMNDYGLDEPIPEVYAYELVKIMGEVRGRKIFLEREYDSPPPIYLPSSTDR